MPRRNRNAGTPRLDTDQLAADLDQLAADLCPGLAQPATGKNTVLVRYLARTITPGIAAHRDRRQAAHPATRR